MKKANVFFTISIFVVPFAIGCNPKNPSVPSGTLTVETTKITIKQNQDARICYKTTNGQYANASSSDTSIAQIYRNSDYTNYNNYIYVGTLGLKTGTCYITLSATNTNSVRVELNVEEDTDFAFTSESLSKQDAACFIDEAMVNKKANIFIKQVPGTSKPEEVINYLELVNGLGSLTGYGSGTIEQETYYQFVFSYFDTAFQTHENTDNYTNLLNANFKIKNDARKLLARTKLPIDDAPVYSQKITNSEQLWWIVEHGYQPQFASTTSNAYKCYQQARNICKTYIDDSMSTIDKCRVFFEYLTCGLNEYDMQYNYWASDGMDSNDDWTKYTDFYIEGPLLHSLGVCDGFSKTFALLCGIEQINTTTKSNGIRSYGRSSAGGHAWNYCSIDNGSSYYLVCPTWGRKIQNQGLYSYPFAFTNYTAFFTSKNYFESLGGKEYAFTDYPWDSINKSTKTYKESSYYPTSYYVNTVDPQQIANVLPVSQLNAINEDYAFTFNYNNYYQKNDVVSAVAQKINGVKEKYYWASDTSDYYHYITIFVDK